MDAVQQVALVRGAARGLGKEVARQLADSGITVIVRHGGQRRPPKRPPRLEPPPYGQASMWATR